LGDAFGLSHAPGKDSFAVVCLASAAAALGGLASHHDGSTWCAPSAEYWSMTGGLFGLLVFAFLAAAALLSLWLYPHLPER
jgi:hypothetical protein